MRLKDFQLDAEALFSTAVFGHGFAHYGYWPDGKPDVPSLQALGAAQMAYFEKLANMVPEGTKSILDVGSGSGSNAAEFLARGYEMECLCPSEQLNQMARAKLGPGTDVHTVKFEDFDVAKTFDICLFAESFHYIDLEPALAQVERYAKKGAVIFDYFRKTGAYEDGKRGSHGAFLQAIENQGSFAVISDEDLTEAILPTFFVTDHMKNELLRPFLTRFRTELAQDHKLYSWLLNRLLGKKLDRFLRQSDRYQTFAERHEYRLIQLARV